MPTDRVPFGLEVVYIGKDELLLSALESADVSLRPDGPPFPVLFLDGHLNHFGLGRWRRRAASDCRRGELVLPGFELDPALLSHRRTFDTDAFERRRVVNVDRGNQGDFGEACPTIAVPRFRFVVNPVGIPDRILGNAQNRRAAVVVDQEGDDEVIDPIPGTGGRVLDLRPGLSLIHPPSS